MKVKYVDTWDLDSIFPGGTNSEELKSKLETIKKEISEYQILLNEWDFKKDTSADTFKTILQKQETIVKGLGQSATFVQMWHDAYMDDEHANVVMGQVMDLFSEVQKLSNTFTKKVVAISDNDWQKLLEDEELKETSFVLNEIRDEGKRLLSEEEERLIA